MYRSSCDWLGFLCYAEYVYLIKFLLVMILFLCGDSYYYWGTMQDMSLVQDMSVVQSSCNMYWGEMFKDKPG